MNGPIPTPKELQEEQADAFEELMAEMYPIYKFGCGNSDCMCRGRVGILVTQLN